MSKDPGPKGAPRDREEKEEWERKEKEREKKRKKKTKKKKKEKKGKDKEKKEKEKERHFFKYQDVDSIRYIPMSLSRPSYREFYPTERPIPKTIGKSLQDTLNF